MKATALQRVTRNTADLGAAMAFYAAALGFELVRPPQEDVALAKLLGVQRVRCARMRLGGQELELSECFPAGAAYPTGFANDHWFQHIAVVSADIAGAHKRVLRCGGVAISEGGPVLLPAAAGGVTAWKFRDPEGHPLELLKFPKETAPGYDHSAISVADVEVSILFYQRLGLSVAARQVNRGIEQDRLDGLVSVAVDVVALTPLQARPHVELLHYRNPTGQTIAWAANDIAADRLVFDVDGDEPALLRDPSGHFVVAGF